MENSLNDDDIDYIRRKRIYLGETREEYGIRETLRQVYYAVRVVYWNPSNEGQNIQYEKDQEFLINYDFK